MEKKSQVWCNSSKNQSSSNTRCVKLPRGRERMADTFSIVSSSEQDENCRKNVISDARHCHGGDYVFLGDWCLFTPTLPGWREQAAEPAGLPLTRLQSGQEPRAGASKTKKNKGDWAGSDVRNPAATVTCCHLLRAAGRGSHHEWDRAGRRFSKGRGKEQEESRKCKWEVSMQQQQKGIMCVFFA